MIIPSWYIFGWTDLIEIGFFSIIIYYFSVWLAQDKRKNLIIPFYSYCLLIIGSAALNVTTMHNVLLIFAPAALLIFIVVHQELLQRNFISLKQIIPAQKSMTDGDWIDSLIRTCLVAFNTKKDMICIIEQRDALQDFINPSLIIETELHKGLLEVLIESNSFDQQKYIWLRSNGTVAAINCTWNMTIAEPWVTSSIADMPSWKQEAILMTQKTDTLVFKSSAHDRLFDVIVQGKQFEKLNTSSMLKLLKKYRGTHPIIAGVTHAPHAKKSNSNQPLS